MDRQHNRGERRYYETAQNLVLPKVRMGSLNLMDRSFFDVCGHLVGEASMVP